MIGMKLGPYEILEKIGAGGMGEVYRAKDTRLGREVAVKVLPAKLCSDPDRLRRFEQEARAAGVLNHPNILAIHDIGRHEGSPYVVSELLEGNTLRARMGGSALPPRKAIDYAVQIAHGLAAAHQKGIVHRDLKPENLFITEDGRVKILDFGLAKLTRPEDAEEGETDLPTMAVDTEPGRVMGTRGYMSPEQVRGQVADHRSDIFTLGVILYEMLTGNMAFRRETAVETMNAILKEEPPELTRTSPDLDPAIDRVVRHCLEKSPAERFQSARDLAFDLETISAGSGVSLAAAAPISEATSREWMTAVAGVVLLIAAASVGFWLGKSSVDQEPSAAPSYQRLTFRRGYVRAARFAPDGNSIVYGAAWEGNPAEIFSTRPESPGSRSLAIPNADLLSISRSGEMAILLNRQQDVGWTSFGTLARVSLGGGAPREVSETVQDADWSPDGTRLAVVRWNADHYTLEYPLGNVIYRTTGWLSYPRISPGGNQVAFFDHPFRGDNYGSVAIVDSAGELTRLTPSISSTAGLAWSVRGDEIWFGGTESGIARDLFAVDLSGTQRLVARVPGDFSLHDIHPSGGVLMSQDSLRREMILLKENEPPRDLSWLDWTLPTDISDDGRKIVFMEQGEGAGEQYDAYLRDSDGSPPVMLGQGASLSLSPDKRWVLALTPDLNATVLLPTGAGEPRLLDLGDIQLRMQGTWLPDGKRLVLAAEKDGAAGISLYVKEIDGGAPRPITPEGTGVAFYYTPVSPDGKYAVSAGPGGEGVWLYPVDEGEARPIAGFEPAGIPLRWSSDGRYLYYAMREPPAIYRFELKTGKKEFWKEIVPPNPNGIVDIGPIHITPDGKTILYGYKRVLSDLYLVRGLH